MRPESVVCVYKLLTYVAKRYKKNHRVLWRVVSLPAAKVQDFGCSARCRKGLSYGQVEWILCQAEGIACSWRSWRLWWGTGIRRAIAATSTGWAGGIGCIHGGNAATGRAKQVWGSATTVGQAPTNVKATPQCNKWSLALLNTIKVPFGLRSMQEPHWMPCQLPWTLPTRRLIWVPEW